MKFITSLSFLLLGANAVPDNDEAAFRVLRGGRGGGRGSGVFGKGQGGMMGGKNKTEILLNYCSENEITCTEVSDDFLANCTKPMRPDGDDNDRDLLEDVEDEIDRELKRGGMRGQGGGKWGNLTESEREELKLKRLTCKCCGDKSDDSSMFGTYRGQGGKGGMMGGKKRTEILLKICAANEITCTEVSDDFLANCTKPMRPDGDDNDRDLLEDVEDEIDRELKRGGMWGQGGGKWGNLTKSEREELKLKRLTCKCCGDKSDDSD